MTTPNSGILELKVKDLPDYIWYSLDLGLNVFVYGRTGIGKTQIISNEILSRCQAEYGDVVFHYIPLSHYAKEDLVGLPVFEKDTHTSSFAPFQNLLPYQEDGKTHLINFDEISHAPLNMLHLLYQLVQMRTFGPFRLPQKTLMIMSGNLREDKGGDKNLPQPLNNRDMVHILANPDWRSFLDYAGRKQWHPRLLAFLYWLQSDDPEAIHDMHPNCPAFPTPRSWEAVNKVMMKEFPLTITEDLASGLVGIPRGRKLAEYIKTRMADLPPLAAIASNPNRAKVPPRSDLQFAVSNAIFIALQKRTEYQNEESVDAFVEYMRRLDPDHGSRVAHQYSNLQNKNQMITDKLMPLVL